MASRISSRTVKEATRFTSQIPQASAKVAAGAPAGETTAQRVARLRSAHLAAREAPLSPTDRLILKSRNFFDVMHRVTQRGLVGLTVVATIFTSYAAYDMIKFNKQRKTEFLAQQAQMEADSLAAARLAYITGTATPEQTAMVEEALAKAEGAQLPPLLDPPTKPIKGSIWDKVDEKVQGSAPGATGEVPKIVEAAATPDAKPAKKWWFF